MEYAKAIKQLRKDRSLSQSDLASLSGITQTALSHIETGDSIPQADTLKKICKGLNVEPAFLMVLSLSSDDVAPEKRAIYDVLMPLMRNLTMQLVQEKQDHNL